MSATTQLRPELESSVCVLHITDNHLTRDPNRERHGINSFQTFEAVVATATQTYRPDLLALTGDIADESVDEVYETFLSTLQRYTKSPMISTPGNHDLGEPFARHLSGRSMSVGSWQVLAVDTHVDDEVGGYISATELQRVKAELTANVAPTLVIGHHPATPIGSPWIDAHRIENGEDWLAQLTSFPHVKGYLCGHVHQAFDAELQGIRLMTSPSTCWQFKVASETFGFDDLAPGWRWLWLNSDGSITTQVARLEARD